MDKAVIDVRHLESTLYLMAEGICEYYGIDKDNWPDLTLSQVLNYLGTLEGNVTLVAKGE